MVGGALRELGCAVSGGARGLSIILAMVEHTSGKLPGLAAPVLLEAASGETQGAARQTDRRQEAGLNEREKTVGFGARVNLPATSIGCNGSLVVSKICTRLGMFQTDAFAARAVRRRFVTV